MTDSAPRCPAPPPVHGFWKTSWDLRQYWLGWDIVLAGALTAGAVLLVGDQTLLRVLSTLLIAEFGLAGAVLGVVIAGLAIIVGFLSREYAAVIDRSEDGAIADFWPFWFVAALAAGAVIAAGAGLLIVDQQPGSRRAVFGVTTFLASYAALATVNLVAFVTTQGVTRAWQLAQRLDAD
jgi:hypothetical protein